MAVIMTHTKRCENSYPKRKCSCECEGKKHGLTYLKNQKKVMDYDTE